VSGKLVGEVIDALESGELLSSLSLVDRLALLAIAEKCHAVIRQGSVRNGRIQAACGKSKSTADRTIRKLKEAGLIRVVKRGYKAHGVAKAPIYELSELSPSKVTKAPDELSSFSNELSSSRAELSSSLDDALDGSLDVSIGGDRPAKSIPEEPPPRTCTQHAHWDGPSCFNCKADKRAHQIWLAASKRLLANLERQGDRATGTDAAAAISHERRNRIAVFQRLGEDWK
jgi:DNA-binding transcriptional ArsR family regulator